MMTYKKFAYGFVIVLLTFLLVNYLIWKNFTESLLTMKYDGGDLARLAYLTGSRDYRLKVNDLPVKHIEMHEYTGQPIDVMTIGDSFSQGGGGGRNSFYQDYIASYNNFTVLNVFRYPTDDLVAFFAPLSTLKVLMESGYLDIIKPKVVLIESVERFCVQRYAVPASKKKADSLEKVREYYSKQNIHMDAFPKVSFINNGNFKYVYYNLLYKLSFNPMKRKVLFARLNRPLFSVKYSDKLLFLREDIDNLKYQNADTLRRLNDTLNETAEALERKGIKLYFMPIVDKYDLYSDYIIDNPYPKGIFFEELRKLPRSYRLIDTRAILAPELAAGVKDVYYADDTHWSWKAAEKIFSSVKFETGR
jgi:hypothetical protein